MACWLCVTTVREGALHCCWHNGALGALQPYACLQLTHHRQNITSGVIHCNKAQQLYNYNKLAHPTCVHLDHFPGGGRGMVSASPTKTHQTHIQSNIASRNINPPWWTFLHYKLPNMSLYHTLSDTSSLSEWKQNIAVGIYDQLQFAKLCRSICYRDFHMML